MIVEFAMNNKVHLATKISSFIANYGRELRIGTDIRRKGKVEKATEFAERMERVWEKVRVALRKAQEKMKKQANKRWREVGEWKKEDKVMLSSKDLVFKERPVKKLTERYVRLYVIEEVVSKNMVKLKLLASIRIHLVVNVSRVVRYREPVKGQRVEKPILVEVDKIEKYMAENNTWEKEEDLKNAKEVDEFEGRMSIEVRW